MYRIFIIENTFFALCDVMSQSILVRPTGIIYLILHKDISLLDCLGLQHSCGDRSVILNICILKYIDLSSVPLRF